MAIIAVAVLLGAGAPIAVRGAEAPVDTVNTVLATASADSGRTAADDFWRSLDPPCYVPLTVRDLDFGLHDAGLDCLVGEGDHVIARMIAGRPWQLGVKPLERFRFNRVEGLVLGGEVRLARAGVRQASLTSGLDYGFAWRRCTHSHKLDVPLLTAKPRDAEGFLVREPWVKLAFEAEGGRTIERFGGDRRPLNDLSALIAGDDPSQYYEMEAWRAGLRYSPHPALTFRVAGGEGEHRGLGVRTEWSFINDSREIHDNIFLDGLRRLSLFSEVCWNYDSLSLLIGIQVHQISEMATGGRLNNKPGYLNIAKSVRARWRKLYNNGNYWLLKSEWVDSGNSTSPEMLTYIGGYGTLRDLDAGGYCGKMMAWLSAEYHFDWNSHSANRFPLMSYIKPMILISGGIVNHTHDISQNCNQSAYFNYIALGSTVNIPTFGSQQLQVLFGVSHMPSVPRYTFKTVLAVNY
ncbi:MAG: hypothetical protein IPI34_14175 [bacterium]|nr:hypothetical protein [bacterium]